MVRCTHCLLSGLVFTSLLAAGLGFPGMRKTGAGRVIGGTDANIEDFPWQLSLEMGGEHRCGASIISDSWALTAAHCSQYIDVLLLTVRAGTSTRESGGVVRDLADSIWHRNFYWKIYDYDIAAFKVSEPFPLGSGVQVVSLPAQGYDPPTGLTTVLTGWGSTSTGADPSEVLQQVELTVLDRAACQQVVGSVATITERQVCAGEAGHSGCNGDSGGPLVSGGVQLGIVSYAMAVTCEESGVVYTSVGGLRSWITDNTGV